MIHKQQKLNNMKKILCILLFLLVTDLAYSQYSKETKQSGFDKSRLSIGGNLSLQFGNYTVVGISPQVGYDFSKYFTAGTGFGYTYFKNSEYDYKWKRSYLSFNTFGRFYPVENIILSVQPEMSRMWETYEYRGINEKNEKFVPSVLIGGGLRYMGVIAMIQYDVIQDDYSPYGDKLFYSLGYTFNF